MITVCILIAKYTLYKYLCDDSIFVLFGRNDDMDNDMNDKLHNLHTFTENADLTNKMKPLINFTFVCQLNSIRLHHCVFVHKYRLYSQ